MHGVTTDLDDAWWHRVRRRPRGFAFVEYASGDRRDAEDAIRGMDGKNFGGRDITVCFSREVCPAQPLTPRLASSWCL